MARSILIRIIGHTSQPAHFSGAVRDTTIGKEYAAVLVKTHRTASRLTSRALHSLMTLATSALHTARHTSDTPSKSSSDKLQPLLAGAVSLSNERGHYEWEHIQCPRQPDIVRWLLCAGRGEQP